MIRASFARRLRQSRVALQVGAKSLVALVLFSSMVSSCTTPKGGTVITRAATVDPSQAMILPAPGGPSIVSVIETRYSNAVEQEVVLSTSAATPGQNSLLVKMYGPMDAGTAGQKSLAYRSLLTSDLGREIRAAMPGVPMHMSGLFLRNNYGPFGYAFGNSASGDSCIYGWQQLRSPEGERSNFRNSGAFQIRLRLCESGSSEKDLLSVMYGYTLTGSFASVQWNPYGSPRSIDADMGSEGSPIYPREAEISAGEQSVVPRPVPRRPRVARLQSDAVVQQREEDAAKSIVDVPAPDLGEVMPATQDTSIGAKVVVPAPGCDGECN
ncbi:cellulose biosynthesis protein BcsN [Rhizobium sp. KVB221]|uniref:Cellulose biosynthesis protein BcsN n=1 Tax=Rhizobium setariae TaxID=2801340 RepID=A0A937CPS8_9HYPH|nr:cellulose biosynthesis protein BcsN [Rhizobium setariae]MBL0372157.1 cellulose biosynthesis protein BcsN [Rhizobium setariae]